MKHALKLVPKSDPPTDITLALRGDILARDWSRCHIQGDRALPIWLPVNWRAPR